MVELTARQYILPQKSNDTLHMYSCTCNSPCSFYIKWIQLVLAFCEGWNNCAWQSATLSLIVNPLSASTRSPGLRLFSKPHLTVRYLSEVRHPHAFDVRHNDPSGVIPMSTFTVCDLASRLEGRSIKTSKQSIIVVFFPKENWNHIGIVHHNSSLSCHLMRGDHYIHNSQPCSKCP